MESATNRHAGVDPLFEALARGDPAALDEICRRYGERVAKLVRFQLGASLRRRLETADLSQEVMMDLVRRAPRLRFDSERAFLRWVQVLIERRIVCAARYWEAARRCHREEAGIDGSRDWPDPMAETPSRILGRFEDADRLALALARLSPRDREVLSGRLFLHLPWQALAASLGIAPGAAQMRFIRARRRLAETLRAPSLSTS